MGSCSSTNNAAKASVAENAGDRVRTPTNMVINMPTMYNSLTNGHETDTSTEPGDDYVAGDSHSDTMSSASGYGSSDEYLSSSVSDHLKMRVDDMSANNSKVQVQDRDMPFEDAEWMIDMPKSPEQCKNRETLWGTPPKPGPDAAGGGGEEEGGGGGGGGGGDTPGNIQVTKRNSFEPQSEAAELAARARARNEEVKSSRERKSGSNKTEHALRFINFNDFKLNFKERRPRNEMPRCPEESHVLVDLPRHKAFDRSTTLVVFVSHTYLAAFDGREVDKDGNGTIVSQRHVDNWRQTPHPDTLQNDKFDLIVRGINLLWQTMAKDMNDCFLWVDYCCLDQDDNPAEELQRIGGYEKIMSFCDCVFTPVVDPSYNSWEYKARTNRIPNWLEDYESKMFCGSNRYEAYLERAWCRLELLYASNLPLWTSGDSKYDDARIQRMTGGLYIASRHSLRAHFLYGTKEDLSGFGLIKLPPIPRGYQYEFNPLNGAVTRPEDMKIISAMWEKLVINTDPVTEYYIGTRNAEKQKNGQGTFTWEDGASYEGGWKCDVQDGTDGIYTWANGEVLQGHWENGRIAGCAKYTNLDGDIYYGEFNEHKQKHGTGQLTYADGDVYEGCFRNGLRHFKGRMRYKDGDEFVGYFKRNKMNGFGSWTYAGGGYFYGYFKNDRRNGRGLFSSGEGTEFEGYYDHGKKHGNGKMTYRNGTVLEGAWVSGRMEGVGVFRLTNGEIQQGYWMNGEYVGAEPPPDPPSRSSASVTPSSSRTRTSSASTPSTSWVTPPSSSPSTPIRKELSPLFPN